MEGADNLEPSKVFVIKWLNNLFGKQSGDCLKYVTHNLIHKSVSPDVPPPSKKTNSHTETHTHMTTAAFFIKLHEQSRSF